MRALLFVAALLLTVPLKAEPAEVAALEASLAWLELVDNGQYAASWRETAPVMQEAINTSDWVGQLQRVRDSLGAAVEREIRSATWTTELPEAPPGEYVVIVFLSTFAEANVPYREIITPMLLEDGQWRVSGYYLQPLENTPAPPTSSAHEEAQP